MARSRASERNRLAGRAAVVGGATLASRVLGFARDLVIAHVLGAGPVADAFFVAFRLPNVTRRLFGEGSLVMAFVPVFTRTRAESGPERAFALARAMLLWLILVLGALTVLAEVFGPQVAVGLAPGFAGRPELLALTTELVRICFPYALLVCAVALCMGVLNSLGHFLAPALAPCVLNVVLIAAGLGALWAGASVPHALAWGVLLAGVLQWALQQPFLRARGFSWRGTASMRSPEARRVGRLLLPTIAGAAAYQISLLLGTVMASFLPGGAISFLYYADRLVQFPLGVFGIAVGTASLPGLSEAAAAGDAGRFGRGLDDAVRLTLYVCLPAAAGLYGLAQPIVSVLFGHGSFGPEAVAATADALRAFAVGLPGVALVRPVAGAFYARQETRPAVRIAMASLILYLVLGALLMQGWGHVGLALATSAAAWVNGLGLCRAMGRRIGPWSTLPGPVWQWAGLSAAIGVGSWALWAAAPQAMAVPSLLLIPAWVAGYLALTRRLGHAEADLAVERLAALAGRLRKT
jgi:putative peptidoglycan lipid II flippase